MAWKVMADTEYLRAGDMVRLGVSYNCLVFTCPSGTNGRAFAVGLPMTVESINTWYATLGGNGMYIIGKMDEAVGTAVLRAKLMANVSAYSQEKLISLHDISTLPVEIDVKETSILPDVPVTTTVSLVAIAILVVVGGILLWQTGVLKGFNRG